MNTRAESFERPLSCFSCRRIGCVSYIVAVFALGALPIIGTYSALSHTADEPTHIAAGMELLDRGEFTYEQQHPPLARLAVAVGPYLLGAHSQGISDITDEGLAILYKGGNYLRTLRAARVGVLPFFVALVAITWAWAHRDFGAMAGATAATILVTTPPLLAHAGLATTDVPVAAGCVVALFAFVRWLEAPTACRSATLGAAVALAITAKLSALAFLPVCFAAGLGLHWRGERGRWSPLFLTQNAAVALLAGATAFGLIVWMVYGCPADPFQPFHQLWIGIKEVARHNARGHDSFFCGEVSQNGHWLFFPTVLLVKTPLPFLVLSGFGTVIVLRRHWREWRYLVPVASVTAILAIAMASRVQLGVRYVLPLYPMLATIAGIGAAFLSVTRSVKSWVLLSMLTIAQLGVSVANFPDYLAYFNVLAGPEPERLFVDSDLDWGQDINRVAVELRARAIGRVFAALHGTADLSQHGFPAHGDLDWYQRATGWIVISLTEWAFGTNPPPFDGYAWLKAFDPVATIGRTVRLYYVDPVHDAVRVSSTDPNRSRPIAIWPRVLTVGRFCER
jgi:4-amino-4-deoxy-L-arabinose transferase-like glycosyltransferase